MTKTMSLGRRSLRALGLLLPVIALGATAAPATAAKYDDAFAEGKASNGYKFAISGSDTNVGLFLTKGGANVNYSTAGGKFSTKKISADLGQFGSVKLKFKPKGDPKKVGVPKNCSGKPGKRQVGKWAGKIKFKGEGGFTRIDARSAKGYQIKYPKITDCGDGGGSPGKYAFLSASNSEGVSFSAGKTEKSGDNDFSASVSESSGGISIFRFVNSTKGEFDYDKNLNSATVEPAAPFKGSASFDAGEGTFKGNLSVDLPGRKNVALAGDDFFATLSRF